MSSKKCNSSSCSCRSKSYYTYDSSTGTTSSKCGKGCCKDRCRETCDDCGGLIVRCASVSLADTTATINVVGTNPIVSTCSEIPASSVMFMGSTAIVTLLSGACSTLVYTTCLCGKEVTVVQLFIRQAAPTAASVTSTTTVSSLLTDVAHGETATVTFRTCVTNTGDVAATNVVVLSNFTSSTGLVIEAVSAPADFQSQGGNLFLATVPSLAAGETRCWNFLVTVSCPDVTAATTFQLQNTVTLNSVSQPLTFALLQCLPAP
jgi:uncharacterized repeat protein (TIGR01451 family)